MNAAARAIERHPIVDRESWLADRLENLNASEIPIVCGVGGFGSRAALYAEKKGLRPPIADSGILRRGRWAEAAVFEALAETRPEWDVRRAHLYLVDRERRMGATPDGFAFAPDRSGPGVVQGKTVARSVFRNKWMEDPDAPIADGQATPPIDYQLQVLGEEMLAECAWGVIATIITGEYDWTFRLFDIERHAEAEARIETDVAAFWRDWLDPGIMPPFEVARDEALVKILYPRDDGTEIDLSQDNRAVQLVDDLVEKRAGRRRLEAELDEIDTELRAKLGPHTYGALGDGRRLVGKTQHRKAYSVPASDSAAPNREGGKQARRSERMSNTDFDRAERGRALDEFANAAGQRNQPPPAGHALVRPTTGIAERVVGAQPVAVKRNEADILEKLRLLSAAAGPDWFYRYPVRKKVKNEDTGQDEWVTDWIEGPSIKLANDTARIFGNNINEVREIDVGDAWTFYARFTDIETGFSMERAYRQRKGQVSVKSKDADRQLDIAYQIGQSKAIRNCIVNALQIYADFAFEGARNSLVEKIGKKLEDYRARTIESIAKIPVELTRVERVIGRSAKNWLAPDIARILAMMQAIADGMASADDSFPPIGAPVVGEPPAAKDKLDEFAKPSDAKSAKPAKRKDDPSVSPNDEGLDGIDRRASPTSSHSDTPPPGASDDAAGGGSNPQGSPPAEKLL